MKIFLALILTFFFLSIVSGAFAEDKCIIIPQEIELNTKLYQNFNITLERNINTGYIWSCSYDKEYLERLDKFYLPENHDPQIIDDKNKKVFKFIAIKTGETQLTMTYSIPWDNCLPAKVITCRVKISE